MGRGVSAGGGQSSLGYLFGGGETTSTPPAAQNQGKSVNAEPSPKPAAAQNQGKGSNTEPSPKSASASQPVENNGKQIPAGIPGNKVNNYFRADGQNCGNFLTDRPSTKVHAAPGGGSSLDYLFGGGGK
ncbi:protein SPIRAL1-like 3 [Cornus florida]|uniref:protein SPIRAL1-like 3 n=1 Tax=Cornus florida TaxID=4283 RepID=UPI002899EAA7|nr:protein SPIRAL1-like 3 [Cornus florida]